MGKGNDKITVGYRYYWDIHAGLGRGPVNEIVSITADKKNVFIGTKNQISSNTSIYINQPNLFGGDDTGGEGGIKGTLDVMMGERSQLPPPSLIDLLKKSVPAFRGMVSTLFSGMISAYSASPKPWAYRVRRTTKGWDKGTWYQDKCLIILRDEVTDIDVSGEVNARVDLMPKIEEPIFQKDKEGNYKESAEQRKQKQQEYQSKLAEREAFKKELESKLIDNVRTIHAMNPAHILIECATNRDWGRGLSYDEIDLDSFKKAADTLYNEGFGVCFRYNRQDTLDAFVQQILDHIGAAQYANIETGKLTLKLIRDDYDPNTLPLYHYDNGILSVEDDDAIGIDSAPNEICVKYKNVLTNQDGEVRAQNLGSIQAVGLISKSVSYPAVPTHQLASRLAQRDLEMTSAGIVKLTLVFDRRGSLLMPADCFRISLPERGIHNMVMRVGKIDENENGSINITAIQDVFGMPSTVYTAANQVSMWAKPDATVYAANVIRVIELPYYLLARIKSEQELTALGSYASFIGVLAKAPSPLSINYELQTCAKGNAFKSKGTGDWIDGFTLLESISKLETTIIFDERFNAEVGDALLIDDEILRIDSIEDNRLTVGRGCVDTLPARHKQGSLAFKLNLQIETDKTEYLVSDAAQVRLLTQTKGQKLPESLATVTTLEIAGRQARPYPPARIAINDALYPDEIKPADNYLLSFASRDRLLQADRLIDCLALSIGSRCEFVIEIRTKQDDVIWQIITQQTAITLPYAHSQSTLNDEHYLVIYSVQNDLESLYKFKATLPFGHVTGENTSE